MWHDMSKPLILASASERRLQLLQQIAVPVRQLILPVQTIDEPRLTNETVVDYVKRTSADKSARAQTYIETQEPELKGLPILTADTTVALEEEIFGKPANADDAQRILSSLIGRTHDVYTAVTLVNRDVKSEVLVHTAVEIDSSMSAVIADYIQSKEPFGKAGAYGIQGRASAYVKNLRGSYSSVVGLPLFETAELLRQAGLYR